MIYWRGNHERKADAMCNPVDGTGWKLLAPGVRGA